MAHQTLKRIKDFITSHLSDETALLGYFLQLTPKEMLNLIKSDMLELKSPLQDPIVNLFVKHEIFKKQQYHNSNTSPLMVACIDKEHLVEPFIKAGADIHFRNKDNTLLSIAIQMENMELAKRLINLGVDIHQRTTNQNNALNLACYYLPNLIPFLVENGAKINGSHQFYRTPLMDLCCAEQKGREYNIKKSFHLLIAAGATLENKDFHGRTALSLAAMHNTAMILLLVEAGANINIQDDNKMTPLMSIAHHHAWQLVDYLDIPGIDFNLHDKDNKNLLFYACNYNCADAIPKLIAKKCKINIQDKIYGDTPLIILAGNPACKPSTIQHLIQNGALLDLQNKQGNTALMSSAFTSPILGFSLLEAGANATITNTKGETALDIARDSEHLKLASSIEMALLDKVIHPEQNHKSYSPSKPKKNTL